MNHRQLQYFIIVAECGSFNKAEEFASLSKQAIKKQIDALEQELGFKLFDRSSQGIVLTPAGTLFLSGAKNILDMLWKEIDCARTKANQQTISVAVAANMPSHFIIACANRFSTLYPNCTVHYVPLSEDQWLDAVSSDLCDLCLCSNGLTEVYNLHYTHVTNLRPVCLIDPKDPLAKQTSIHIDDILTRRLYIHDNFFHKPLYGFLQEKQTLFQIEEVWFKYKVVLLKCASGGIFITSKWNAPNYAPLAVLELDDAPSISWGFAHKEPLSAHAKQFIHVAQSHLGS